MIWTRFVKFVVRYQIVSPNRLRSVVVIIIIILTAAASMHAMTKLSRALILTITIEIIVLVAFSPFAPEALRVGEV